MFTILLILTIIYAIFKFLNMRAEFERRDAERAAREAEAAAQMEEFEEEEEMRSTAIDVEADTIETTEAEDVAFSVEEKVPEYEEV
ncbi:MAG: hypothetical protein IKE85_06920 [Mogibacterium sp.]|nr:hypothetical protein [Mogibacterium sp.]MBR2540542.1 hypothetical protein [Mogibacterium sp.]